MNVLLIAADRREFSGLLRRCEGLRRLRWPVDWARAALCGGRSFYMVANGCGPERAASAAREALSRAPADAVVSCGFCGALDAGLKVGDIFVATAVEAGGERFAVGQPGQKAAHRAGVLQSQPRVAQTAREKGMLRASGASAVEMEAGGLAREILPRGLPFYCVRAVTDLAKEDFILNFNAALRADGHFDTMILLRLLLRRPVRVLPELLRLRRRCVIASRNLGEFIADCRF